MSRDSYLVQNVFTPTKPARSTFVERKSINDSVVAALETPGKQLVVFGYSGSGKTTLLVNKLHQLYEGHITTRCYGNLSFDQLILDAFDRLGPFYDAERTNNRKSSIGSSVQGDYVGLKAQITASLTSETQTKQVRALPPQLTPQTLATFLGEAGCCWVLDDFHKIASKEKKTMAQVMKLFMDMADSYNQLKIIAIGAVDSARQVIEYDPEMRNRVSEVYVPLMTEDEIKEIPAKGEELLNFRIPTDIKKQIIGFSDGIPSVCHQLCLNMCFEAGIRTTLSDSVEITSDIFEKALEQYVEQSSDTLKAAFDKAFRPVADETKRDGELVLRSLLECGHDGETKEDILRRIRVWQPKYRLSNLSQVLKRLQAVDRGELIRYDPASGRFSFSENIYRAYAATYFERARRKERKNRTIDVDTTEVLEVITKMLHEWRQHSS